MTQPSSAPGGETRLALTAGVGCYLIWGFMPLAFQLLGRMGVGPWEILAHRILWATPAALVFVLAAGQAGQVVRVFSQPRVLGWLAFSSAMIAVNWTVFVWAATSQRLIEAGLGYYLTPLVNMAAAALIFRERLDRLTLAAIGMAVAGVAIQAVALGHLPLISLALGLSFGAYGIARKKVAADAQTGLFVECLLVMAPALAYVLWLGSRGESHLTASFGHAAWLVACGPITAVPLVLFSWAARRIPMATIGFLQFLSPTLTFLLGLIQGEPFTPLRALSFLFIWAGAAVFIYGAWRASRMIAAVAEPA